MLGRQLGIWTKVNGGRKKSKAPGSGGLVAWLVMKAHQLIGTKCERSVRLTGVIAELNFVQAGRKTLDDGADLAAPKSLLRDILEQGNHS
jgi:hypothetical protein